MLCTFTPTCLCSCYLPDMQCLCPLFYLLHSGHPSRLSLISLLCPCSRGKRAKWIVSQKPCFESSSAIPWRYLGPFQYFLVQKSGLSDLASFWDSVSIFVYFPRPLNPAPQTLCIPIPVKLEIKTPVLLL